MGRGVAFSVHPAWKTLVGVVDNRVEVLENGVEKVVVVTVNATDEAMEWQ